MSTENELNSPIDPNTTGGKALLEGIQGNIVQAHGREYAALLLIRLKDEAGASGKARRWIASFADRKVTSAYDEWRKRKKASSAGTSDPFAMVLLSAYGYDALGLSSSMPEDHYFQSGMRAGQYWPGGGGVDQWEHSYKTPPHVLILFAGDSERTISHFAEEAKEKLTAFCTVEREVGYRNLQEHFGYRDSISQPLFVTDQIERYRNRHSTLHRSPQAPVKAVLAEEADPNSGYGSYMVFLKLEQNVQAFQNAVEVLADRLSLRGGAREYASALIVGRYPDGRPLSSTPMKESDMDDFNFSDDPDGRVCPFHSHIRKMNPRPGANTGQEGLLPIARRSVLYDERPDRTAGAAVPTDRVGLLFMSFQGDLAQFVWHQRRADDPDFPVRNAGLDPLCGADRSTYGVPAQTWTGPRTERFRFQDFVRMKGGEYFFAPSIPFLKTLGK